MSIVPRKSLNALPVLTAAVAGTDDQVIEIQADDQGYLIVANAVIDEDGDWVPMTQPTIEATISGAEISIPEYKYNLFEYDAYGNAIYIGENASMTASISGTDWEITKVEYDAYSNVVNTRQKTGAWSDRTTGW